jgi:hypothetical protein
MIDTTVTCRLPWSLVEAQWYCTRDCLELHFVTVLQFASTSWQIPHSSLRKSSSPVAVRKSSFCMAVVTFCSLHMRLAHTTLFLITCDWPTPLCFWSHATGPRHSVSDHMRLAHATVFLITCDWPTPLCFWSHATGPHHSVSDHMRLAHATLFLITCDWPTPLCFWSHAGPGTAFRFVLSFERLPLLTTYPSR